VDEKSIEEIDVDEIWVRELIDEFLARLSTSSCIAGQSNDGDDACRD
jgi:hypothetical protein